SDGETWQNVLDYAKDNLVEWHNDKSSLHLIVYLHEAIEGVTISFQGHSKEDHRQIEVRAEGQLLRVRPSMHRDGHRFTALNSEIIPVYDGIKRLGFKAKIHSLYKENSFKDYLNEHENQAISDWL